MFYGIFGHIGLINYIALLRIFYFLAVFIKLFPYRAFPMIHAFDYSRYGETIINVTHRNNMEVIFVNPAYTTKIGSFKYSSRMKLNPHQGAAYVIARKGMGYIDRLKRKPKRKAMQ